MDNKYEFSITKVNYIINELSENERVKIPENVINFFNNNSNDSLLYEIYNENIKTCNLNEMDRNFLKIIDYYLNGD